MNRLQDLLLAAATLTSALVGARAFRYLGKRRAGKARSDPFNTFAALTILNFFAFWWVAVLSGGDALNGKRIGNQYFLGEHGRYTQVSFGFWLYSLNHTWITILSFSGMFLGQIYRIFTGKVDVFKDEDEFRPSGRGTV